MKAALLEWRAPQFKHYPSPPSPFIWQCVAGPHGSFGQSCTGNDWT